MRRCFSSSTRAILACLALTASGCWIAPQEVVLPEFDSPEIGDAFWSHWGDGLAEVASYDLVHPHYGAERRGTAVAIFVTEAFDAEQRVKVNSGEGVLVMKLNLVEDFPTGVYDYNLMTSAFVALEPALGRPAGTPYKISFSAQEWCGQSWQQWLFDPASIRRTAHSYFQDEADEESVISLHPKGVAEDALWHWARGFSGPMLEPGGKADLRMLPAMKRLRQSHEDPGWVAATLTRSSAPETIEVPAGSFEVEKFTASSPGFSRAFFVEAAAPHRIIRWETSEGETAELVGAERMEYWKMNGPDSESAVERLGLSPRPPRTM